MSRNEITDLLLDELDKYGIEGTVSDRGKHLAVVWQVGSRLRQLFTSRTSSDWRAGMNARSQLRQFLKEDGVALKEPTSFDKAMSLPKVPRIPVSAQADIHHKDFETLCDLVFDLQSQIRDLEGKLSSVTVTSRVEFGPVTTTRQVQDSIQELAAAPDLKVSHETRPTPTWVLKPGTRPYQLLAEIPSDGKAAHAKQLAEKLDMNVKAVYVVLHRLHHGGYIVSPMRGWWQRV